MYLVKQCPNSVMLWLLQLSEFSQFNWFVDIRYKLTRLHLLTKVFINWCMFHIITKGLRFAYPHDPFLFWWFKCCGMYFNWVFFLGFFYIKSLSINTLDSFTIPIGEERVTWRCLKTVDKISNCHRLAFTVASKLRDNNERKKHPCHMKVCVFRWLFSDMFSPQLVPIGDRSCRAILAHEYEDAHYYYY